MDPASKTPSQWSLCIAIHEATQNPSGREGRWYGPWSIVLNQFLFPGFCTFPFFTVSYPQYPVSNDDDKEDEFEEDAGLYTDRSAAPSPEIFSGARHLLPVTPPKTLPRNATPSMSPGTSSSPEPPSQRLRSTRIPDFVQRLQE